MWCMAQLATIFRDCIAMSNSMTKWTRDSEIMCVCETIQEFKIEHDSFAEKKWNQQKNKNQQKFLRLFLRKTCWLACGY